MSICVIILIIHRIQKAIKPRYDPVSTQQCYYKGKHQQKISHGRGLPFASEAQELLHILLTAQQDDALA